MPFELSSAARTIARARGSVTSIQSRGRRVPAPRAGRARPARSISPRATSDSTCSGSLRSGTRSRMPVSSVQRYIRVSAASTAAWSSSANSTNASVERKSDSQTVRPSGSLHRSEAAASYAHVRSCRVPRRRTSAGGRASSTGQGARAERLRCRPPRRAARPGPTVRRGTRRTQDARGALPPTPPHHGTRYHSASTACRLRAASKSSIEGEVDEG